MELSEPILGLRKKAGVQDEPAEAPLVSRPTIYRWETGKTLQIVDRLGCPPHNRI